MMTIQGGIDMSDSQLWTEKYRPETLEEVVGRDEEIQEVVEWIENWDSDSDALLFYGPPGTGKTTVAECIANDYGYISISVNASDDRNKSDIEHVLEAATQGQRKLIIVDEVDSLGSGSRTVNKLIKDSESPVILIGNDYYDGIKKSIRNKCNSIEFDGLNQLPMVQKLAEIAEAEGVDTTKQTLKELVRQNNTKDLRAAVNDFQASVTKETQSVTKDVVDNFYGGRGNRVAVYGETIDSSELEEVKEFLDTYLPTLDCDILRIRGSYGFEYAVMQVADEIGMDYEVVLPKRLDDMEHLIPDSEFNDFKWYCNQGESVQHLWCYNESIVPSEFADWLFFDVKSVLCYVEGEPDTVLQYFYSDSHSNVSPFI